MARVEEVRCFQWYIKKNLVPKFYLYQRMHLFLSYTKIT